MRTYKTSSLLVCSLLAACGGEDPPTPAATRTRIAADLGAVLTQANAAQQGAQLPSLEALTTLANLIPALGGSSASTTSAAKRVMHLAAADGDAIDTQVVIDYLDNTIFTDANSLGNGLYQVPASVVCTTTTVDDQGNETQAIDATCATKLAQAQLRLRVASNGDTLELAVQVDANHDEPLTFSLSSTSAGVSVDLDDASDAIAALAGIFAETPPNVRLSGAATARLDILGTAHAKASLSIDRAITVAVADQGQDLEGAKAIKFSSAQANVLAFELDGAAHSGSAALALGATKLQIPAEDDTTFAIDVPGATARAGIVAGGPALITNVSLGDRTLTISKNGTVAASIDLNPDNGRTLNASLASDGTFTPSPKLDVHFYVNHAALGDGPSPYDVTQVIVDGAVRPHGDGSLEVVSGGMMIAANPQPASASATVGQCMAQVEVTDADSGAFYEQWVAATCQ